MTAARDHEPGLDDLGPAALLDALATVDRRSRQAEADKLALAYQWAITHPATTQTGTSTWGGDSFLLTDESLDGEGCPAWRRSPPNPSRSPSRSAPPPPGS
jgi:hypothetical protein